MTEKITYLVTNYNNEKYIGECLQSIVNQSNQDWLCLVIDDASTDGSVSVISQFVNDKIKFIRNTENIDQVKSLKKLIDLSQTDIVCIVDSDDALHRDATEHVIKAFNTSKKIGFVYTNCIKYDEKLVTPLTIGLSQRIPFGPTSSIVNGYPGHLRCFRKSDYYKTSGYNDDLLYAEDLDLGYKLEEVCLPYFINLFLYKHRRISGSRGRKTENRLIGYKNRALAKNLALRRRKVKGLSKILIKLYIYSEYKACSYKVKKDKVKKYIMEIFMSTLKSIINKMHFKNIASSN